MDFSNRSNQVFVITLIVIIGWLILVAVSSVMNLDKALLSGIEKAAFLLLGYWVGTNIGGTKE